VIRGDFNCQENALNNFGGNVSVGSECKSLKSGPGVWKLNNLLLDDKSFCDIIQNLIQSRFIFCFVSVSSRLVGIFKSFVFPPKAPAIVSRSCFSDK